jgi:hypothetical protein
LFVPLGDFVALLVTALWIIATSVILFRERGEAPKSVTAGMATSAPSQKGSV